MCALSWIGKHVNIVEWHFSFNVQCRRRGLPQPAHIVRLQVCTQPCSYAGFHSLASVHLEPDTGEIAQLSSLLSHTLTHISCTLTHTPASAQLCASWRSFQRSVFIWIWPSQCRWILQIPGLSLWIWSQPNKHASVDFRKLNVNLELIKPFNIKTEKLHISIKKSVILGGKNVCAEMNLAIWNMIFFKDFFDE